MNKLETGLRIFIGLTAIVLAVNGFLWSFIPAGNLDTYSITTNTATGINMLKSDIGGGLFAAAIFLFMYAWRRGFWFYPAIIATGSYLLVRTVSLIVDGSHPTVFAGIALEALVAIVLVVLWRMELAE